MIPIKDIYAGAERLITELLRKESTAQGHYLKGKLEDSITGKVGREAGGDTLTGFAVAYAQYVEHGVPAESASFKQAPFLIEYFKRRGLEEKEATAAAFATIKVWMKQGMSTQASKRFSQTGSRQHFIENAFEGNSARIDEYMSNAFDFAAEEAYREQKSETI